ncbi:MAG: flippase-like domain-containing protein [Halobacteriovoraceae bacterium]|jgi:glycosyltransferase 2 family protein|nr:flippase-like domain-containing protein [Halobacteriovoraceae bacterium]MBT5094527.1 flippase-like domain-containing protein [Halobacteriovoraceae bacterium]
MYWLFRSGKLDFSLVGKSLHMGYGWLACLTCIFCQALFSSFRWKILLRIGTQAPLPAWSMIRLTWIGLFFNSVLPGAVTGDFIKMLYARDLDKNLSKTYLLTSVLMDRILGLFGLLFLLGLFSIFNYNAVIAVSPKIKNLLHFNFLLFAGVIVFFATLFLKRSIQELILKYCLVIPKLGKFIHNTLQQVWLIGRHKKAVFTCLAMSMALQFSNILAFYFISSPFYGVEVSLPHVFTFIPIGFIAVAIPITPAGLGTGHVAFQELFSLFGIQGGSSFFNLYFLCMISINLLGFIPYMLSGKKHSLSETKEFENLEAQS